MVTTASPQLIPFTMDKEGFVGTPYRDSGGVLTIGTGFTALSAVFNDYWMKTKGHKLRKGDSISRSEANTVLGLLIANEYAPPVLKRFGDSLLQHRFDGSTDMSYNCGAGSLKDRWAAALARGDVSEAARLLLSDRITAGGRMIPGLKRRRAAEARLIQFGDYGTVSAVPAAVSQTVEDIKAYQTQLMALKIYQAPGTIDGLADSSYNAVVAFQIARKLKADGIVGPATRAELVRALEIKNHTTIGIVSSGGGGSAVAVEPSAVSGAHVDWGTVLTAGKWIAIIAVAAIVVSALWRYRGVILRKRTPA